MATTYTKSALNKIKKVDLVQLFLDQQAKMNDMELSMEKEKYDGRWAEDVHAINMKDKEIEKLKVENENLKGEVNFWSGEHKQIKIDYDRLDEHYQFHKKAADNYEKKLLDRIEVYEKGICELKLLSFD